MTPELPWLQLGWTHTGLPSGPPTGAYLKIGELFLRADARSWRGASPSIGDPFDWSVRSAGDELAGGSAATLRAAKAAAVLHAGACVSLVSAWNQRIAAYHCESCKAALEEHREPRT